MSSGKTPSPLDPFIELSNCNQSTSPLLALPAELRNQIWELCIPNLQLQTVSISAVGDIATPLALIATCHQIGHEVTPLILEYAARNKVMLIFGVHDLDFDYAMRLVEALDKQAMLALVQTAAVCFRCTLSATAVSESELEDKLTSWLRFCVDKGLFMNKHESYGKRYCFEGEVEPFRGSWFSHMTEIAEGMHDKSSMRQWQLSRTLPKQELYQIVLACDKRNQEWQKETWERNWSALPEERDAFSRLEDDVRQKGKEGDVSYRLLCEARDALHQSKVGQGMPAKDVLEQRLGDVDSLNKTYQEQRKAFREVCERVRLRRNEIQCGLVNGSLANGDVAHS